MDRTLRPIIDITLQLDSDTHRARAHTYRRRPLHPADLLLAKPGPLVHLFSQRKPADRGNTCAARVCVG
jgi:hypothetical protein